MTLQVIGVFCEDIREEKSGQLTLIGVLPDVISIPKRPSNIPENARERMPKLGLYVRINMGVDDQVAPMVVKLVLPDAVEIDLGPIDAALIAKAKTDAIGNGLPIAGIVHHAVLQGFVIPGPGIVSAAVDTGGQRHTCSVMKFVYGEA